MKILVTAATQLELNVAHGICCEGSEKKHTTDLLLTGLGSVATAYALTKALSQKLYDLVLNIGIAGSFSNKYPEDVQAQFKRNFWDVGVHFELDFFKYGPESWDRDIKWYTPYILLGPGLTVYKGQEGNAFAPNLAFGVGYKHKLLDRLNIGVEWSMRKLFKDDFDVTNPFNEILDDPYGAGHSWLKNNDWYSCAFVFITLDIIRVKGECREMKQ